MPIHDWTKLPAGDFHDFHQTWTPEIKRVLNAGILPEGFFAHIEQKSQDKKHERREPDVLAIDERIEAGDLPITGGAIVAERPRTELTKLVETDLEYYARKANRLTVRHRRGSIVAIIEIVSPGNKHSKKAIRNFANKIEDFIRDGVHVLVVDLFPPTRRDPAGIHKVIMDRFCDDPFELPPSTPLILASYCASDDIEAFIERVAVGSPLPEMPLFITPDLHVRVPLEKAYLAAMANTIEPIKVALESESAIR